MQRADRFSLRSCDPDSGPAGAAGWTCGAPGDYDREYCLDLAQLSTFLRETQREIVDALDHRAATLE